MKKIYLVFVLFWFLNIAKGQALVFDSTSYENTYSNIPVQTRWFFLQSISFDAFTVQSEVDQWLLDKLKNYPDLIESRSVFQLREMLYSLWKSGNNESFYFLSHLVLKNVKSNSSLHYAIGIAAYGKVKYLTDHFQTNDASFYLNLMKRGTLLDFNKHLFQSYYQEMANVNYYNGNLVNAIIYYFKVLDYSGLNDKIVRSVFQNLSVCYNDLGNLERAESYLKKGLIFPYPEAPHVETIMTLGVLYKEQKRMHEAEAIFQEVKDYAIAKKESLLLARSYFNLQVVQIEKKQYNLALQYLDSAETIFIEIDLAYGILLAELYRAGIYTNMGEFEKSERLAKALESEVKAYNSPQLMEEYSGLMQEIYDSLGNKTQANSYFRLNHELQDKLIGRENLMAINELEIVKQKNFEDAKKASIQAVLEKYKHRNVLIILFSALFLLVVISIFLFIRKKNQLEKQRILIVNKEIRHDLELKSRERLTDSMKNLSLENLKEQIHEDLMNVISNLPSSQQNLFQDLVKNLNRRNKDSLVQEFEDRFIGVHQEFFVNLREIAPDLSSAEIKLCAFIKLNLTTKEISYLTNRTVGTIDNSRSRIRRKLGLKEEDNLFIFLSNL